jgi:hypothetical protein
MQTKGNNQSADNLVTGYLKGELIHDEAKELISCIKLNRTNKRYSDEYYEIWVPVRASLKNPGYIAQGGFGNSNKKFEELNKRLYNQQ